MRFDWIAFGLKRFRMLWAALALSTAVGVATPAAGAMILTAAPPGGLVTVDADWFDWFSFFDEGTNPRFTDAVFSTTEYYRTEINDDGELLVRVKTAAELSALPSPPPSFFTVDATVTMTNDEGETATGTITFETTYERTATTSPQPSEPPAPTLSQTETLNLPVNTMLSFSAGEWFDNAGTNAQITNATLSTAEYYHEYDISRGMFFVQTKTAAELNAMASPPPSPFTVDVIVAMTNDERETATGTVTFQTTYERTVAPTPPPSEPEEPEDAGPPTFSLTRAMTMGPSMGAGIHAHEVFDNVGTNARITEAVFSTRDYLGGNYNKVAHGQLWLRIKSTAELNAMAAPPPSPFRFNVDVTMANDEGETASGTITFQVRYERDTATTSSQASEPAATGPTFSQTETIDAPPGIHVPNRASRLFDNAGTNPRITEAVYSTQDYYHWGGTGIFRDGTVNVQVKTAAELNAMEPPPPSPFTVTVDVTMTNDEGETATGTLTFRTTYERTAATTPEEPEAAAGPTFSQTGTITAPPGGTVTVLVDDVFDNAGTNPVFQGVGAATTYLDFELSDDSRDRFTLTVKTAAELNALRSPPPSPFTVTVSVRMTNDEDQSAWGAIAFETTYERRPTTTSVPPTSHPPTAGGSADPPE